MHIEQSIVSDFRPFVPTIAVTTFFVRLLKTRSANMEKHYGPIIVLVNKVQHGLHLLLSLLSVGLLEDVLKWACVLRTSCDDEQR